MSMLYEGEVAVVVAIVFQSRLNRSWGAAHALGVSVSVPEGLVLVLPPPRRMKRVLWMRLARWVGSMACL